MKCPHCRVNIHPSFRKTRLAFNAAGGVHESIGKEQGINTHWTAHHMACPSSDCGRAIIHLEKLGVQPGNVLYEVYPRSSGRQPAPVEVPDALANDYNEAGAVLSDSPKASAALSRRCMQMVLQAAGYSHHNLSQAIKAALDANTLPHALALNLDAVREIGNFAAHPLKDENSGAIVDVEPEEAEWNLEVLDSLFDFYYVQPALNRQRVDALNKKLEGMGRKPIQQPKTPSALQPGDAEKK